jgi:type III pantothenate kinase
MPKLLIDRGNSFIKWQLHEAGAVMDKGVAPNQQKLEGVFACLEGSSVSSIIVGSVSGDGFKHELNAWALSVGFPKPRYVCSEAEAFGVKNAYANPEQLGVDRWLAIIAAHRAYPGLVCIVDCGTAYTIDFVNRHGLHLGGFILPGISLMKTSLLKNTHKIESAEGGEHTLLGLNTDQAVGLAPAQALVAFTKQKVADVSADQDETVALVLTGGESSALEPLLESGYHVDPDLIFKGLELYAQEST